MSRIQTPAPDSAPISSNFPADPHDPGDERLYVIRMYAKARGWSTCTIAAALALPSGLFSSAESWQLALDLMQRSIDDAIGQALRLM